MTEWIIIAVLYVPVLLAVRLLGGFGAAATAFKDWGCAVGRVGGDSAGCP
jgi:hypothetical protein